ncbi:vWA domain-containing protein [Flavihumibacter solisilvae]|uniref:von Willebrand factor A n=1 Tax=Flavihumibacter solisilvae TaxID=1349421 RepID=A0A0C1L584_9BACT|nr:VWA domain-containing protein [Flavihumibacter solisilvae]KIC94716.1 von Willebrand factor A [Flavihumibacter solisilvae]
MFHFENIFLLAGLAAVPVIILLYLAILRWKKKTAIKIGDPAIISGLTRNFSAQRYFIKMVLACTALVLLVVAAANPRTKGESGNVNRKGVDVMIVMDVSKSMLAQDVKPNRLEKAKQLVSLLIEDLADNRIGLIWFAGRAYLQMPLTTDVSAAKMYLQNAGPEAVPTQGTVIGEALRMAGSSFNSKEKKHKAIILISDGEDHDPEALNITRQLVESGVMINTVGIGSPEGATIFDPLTNDTKRDANGNTVISKLNEAQLRELAQQGNGVYVYLQDAGSAVKTLAEQLGSIEQKQLQDSSFIQYNTYFYYFLAVVLLLLLVELFTPERKISAA